MVISIVLLVDSIFNLLSNKKAIRRFMPLNGRASLIKTLNQSVNALRRNAPP